MGQIDPNALASLIATTNHKKNSSSFILACPRCGKHDKLYVRRRDGRYVCWVCQHDGVSGAHPEYILAQVLGRPVEEIQKLLYGELIDWTARGTSYLNFEVELPPRYSEYDPVDEFQELPAKMFPPDFTVLGRPSFEPGRAYLHSRGITDDLIEHYNLRYHPSSQRVIIPVIVNDRLVGWQGRYIKPTDFTTEDGEEVHLLKVLSTKGLAGGQVLMFQDNLRGSEHAVLTEGPFDAMKAHLCGGNVASMGKAMSEEKLRTLISYGAKRVYLGLDPDAATELQRIVRFLVDKGVEVYQIVVPENKEDLGECSPEEVAEAFKNAHVITPSRVFTYTMDYWDLMRTRKRMR